MTAEQHDPTPDQSAPVRRHRLELRSSGDPRFATIHLDGEQLTFVSRVDLVIDVDGKAEARLTIPAHMVDIDADVAVFVTAHALPPTLATYATVRDAAERAAATLAKGIAGAENDG